VWCEVENAMMGVKTDSRRPFPSCPRVSNRVASDKMRWRVDEVSTSQAVFRGKNEAEVMRSKVYVWIEMQYTRTACSVMPRL